MKRPYLFLCFLILSASASYVQAQGAKKKIGSFEFVIDTLVESDTNQIEFLQVFSEGVKRLTHRLYELNGDCSSINLTLGSYEIKDSAIILYSYWASGDRMGANLYPFGFRKQVYTVNSQGWFDLTHSGFYVESFVEGDELHAGMRYLKEKPTSLEQQKYLEEYISWVEQKYKAKFVFDSEKRSLEQEVRFVLSEQIKRFTEGWEEIYGTNCHF